MNVPRRLMMTGVFLCAGAAQAKVMPEPLSELVILSDRIVVARVLSVSEATDGQKRAAAEVLEVWKGGREKEVVYLASRTWACDVSSAEVGESAVLFLAWSESRGEFVIAKSGHGRMPLREIEGRPYATIQGSVVLLPAGTPTIDVPDDAYGIIRSIELDLLRTLVSQAVAASNAREVVDQ